MNLNKARASIRNFLYMADRAKQTGDRESENYYMVEATSAAQCIIDRSKEKTTPYSFERDIAKAVLAYLRQGQVALARVYVSEKSYNTGSPTRDSWGAE